MTREFQMEEYYNETKGGARNIQKKTEICGFGVRARGTTAIFPMFRPPPVANLNLVSTTHHPHQLCPETPIYPTCIVPKVFPFSEPYWLARSWQLALGCPGQFVELPHAQCSWQQVLVHSVTSLFYAPQIQLRQ